MPQGRAGDPLKTLLRLLGAGLIGLLATGAAIWGGLALWFALPGADGVRATLALGFAALGAGSLLTALLRRRLIVPLLPFGIAFVALLAWWSTIEASNDRAWQGDVAMLPLPGPHIFSAARRGQSFQCLLFGCQKAAASEIDFRRSEFGPALPDRLKPIGDITYCQH